MIGARPPEEGPSDELPLYVDGRPIWMSLVNVTPETAAEIVAAAPKEGPDG